MRQASVNRLMLQRLHLSSRFRILVKAGCNNLRKKRRSEMKAACRSLRSHLKFMVAGLGHLDARLWLFIVARSFVTPRRGHVS